MTRSLRRSEKQASPQLVIGTLQLLKRHILTKGQKRNNRRINKQGN